MLEIKLLKGFALVLDTSNFDDDDDDDKIKHEQHGDITFTIISLLDIFRHSKADNSAVSCQIWPKFVLIQDSLHVFVTCKFKKGPAQ